MPTTDLLVLHLDTPLQSYATSGLWQQRATEPWPTRTALIGLLAAAAGIPRGGDLAPLSDALHVTIRVDRPGTRRTDYHTVGGGQPRERTAITSNETYRTHGKGTIQSWREYLADAAFTIALTSMDDRAFSLDTISDWLAAPHWAPYCGRRAFPLTSPLILSRTTDDPNRLLRHLPLHRRKPNADDSVRIEFLADTPPHDRDTVTTVDTVRPGGATELYPVHTSHTMHRWWEHLPATGCAGYSDEWLDALARETA
ncbi:CRISPR system Cascade subunit CasD [Prauserella sediminis]|uniref:CRISPR system Cascade subunit CasD n=1 Tax=Prauserella sediminis TaxID=577680 RepID=A0A839XR54_9PSEU|nr:type I-E CRISPR-associated protein Cas5/CasD [Prauserella sediminis]MBB3665211.1 CRISPR system Cascade subunit CasD [Prauserella sediminis]